jgi:hypothetical protein
MRRIAVASTTPDVSSIERDEVFRATGQDRRTDLSTGNSIVAVNARQTLTWPAATFHEHRRARTLPAAAAVVARLGEPLTQTGVSLTGILLDEVSESLWAPCRMSFGQSSLRQTGAFMYLTLRTSKALENEHGPQLQSAAELA